MRLFHGTIDALAAAQAEDRDAFEAVDEAVGWAKLLRVRDEVKDLANLADEDPLLRAADRWKTLSKIRAGCHDTCRREKSSCGISMGCRQRRI